jgi:predicted 3-demethylubiquinone-9 3-methyltransferase (glyoxalase superfamily)
MSSLQSSPRITLFLWFDSNAEEAVDFYLTVFKNSRKIDLPTIIPIHPSALVL